MASNQNNPRNRIRKKRNVNTKVNKKIEDVVDIKLVEKIIDIKEEKVEPIIKEKIKEKIEDVVNIKSVEKTIDIIEEKIELIKKEKIEKVKNIIPKVEKVKPIVKEKIEDIVDKDEIEKIIDTIEEKIELIEKEKIEKIKNIISKVEKKDISNKLKVIKDKYSSIELWNNILTIYHKDKNSVIRNLLNEGYKNVQLIESKNTIIIKYNGARFNYKIQ